MQNFDDFWQKLFALVEDKFRGCSSCHDFDHTLRVLHNAQMLAKKLPQANYQIVSCTALLHDIARADEDASKGGCCHALKGADIAAEILQSFHIDSEFIAQVAHGVKTHRYRSDLRPDSLEAQIVFDADKLDSLGAIGVGRAFLFAGAHHAKLHNLKEVAINAEEYTLEDTAYREYLVKLRHLPQSMLTTAGRELAYERAEFMHKFFTQLNLETGINEA